MIYNSASPKFHGFLSAHAQQSSALALQPPCWFCGAPAHSLDVTECPQLTENERMVARLDMLRQACNEAPLPHWRYLVAVGAPENEIARAKATPSVSSVGPITPKSKRI